MLSVIMDANKKKGLTLEEILRIVKGVKKWNYSQTIDSRPYSIDVRGTYRGKYREEVIVELTHQVPLDTSTMEITYQGTVILNNKILTQNYSRWPEIIQEARAIAYNKYERGREKKKKELKKGKK